MEGCNIISKTEKILLHTVNVENGLYPFLKPDKSQSRAQLTKKKISSEDWHSILGHVGVQRLMIATKLCDGIGLVNEDELKMHQ